MLQKSTDTEKKLSQKQVAALPHLALADSVAEGARRAGIARTTFYKWLSDPAFRQQLDELRQEVAEITRYRIQHMTGTALQVIEDSLHDQSATNRLRAAVTTLDLAQKALHNQDVARRLSWLEDSLTLRKERRW